MDNILFLTLLYDFYSDLLTHKQKAIFYMYYQDNLSLSEIGDMLGTTRQAVRDILSRTEKKMLFYEDKLALVDRFINQKKLLSNINSFISDIEKNIHSTELVLHCVEKIKNELEEL